MESYQDILQETFRNPEWWNYYNSTTLESMDIFNPEDCRKIINGFFKESGKDDDLNTLLPHINDLKANRCQHIVFTYLLGIYFYNTSKKIKRAIDQKLKKYEEKFPFVWFLICLFHDLGCPTEMSFADESVINSKSLKAPSGVPKFYREVYKNYYKYRMASNVNDHGIYAGLRMFRDLCEIRKNKEKNSEVNKHPLFWGEELEKVYNLAAWIVLCHNIWYANEADKITCNLYKEYNLDQLILRPKEYKLQFTKYPLLFLFCLIDSIEAVKVVKNADLLNMIFLEIKETANTLELKFDSSLMRGCKIQWMNKVFELDNWLANVSDKKILIN